MTSADTWRTAAEHRGIDLPIPQHGEALLDHVRDAIGTYCILPSPAHLDAVTLWVAATHCLPAFDYATRLVIRSAEKRSGKSRLLEVIDALSHRPLRAVNATVAALFRSLGGEHPPTLLLDEADTIFGSRKVAEQNEDLRGLLNAGYQRGLPVLRTVGPQHEPREFHTFAMVALAGIGAMPDTIEDRAVVVVMRRRKPSEVVKPYRLRRDQPELHRVRDALATWGQTIIDDLMDADPALPVEDRAADTWAPLVAVADAAGGHWPQRGRAAALALTSEAEEHDREGSMNMKLLADIQEIFAEHGSPFIKSDELCHRLHQVEDSPWKEWDLTPSRLGHRLREYGIRTGHNTAKTERGYRLESFTDAFERYTRPKSSEVVQAAEYQQKTPDTFKPPDTFKASEDSKSSGYKPRDHAERTPSDTFGQDTGAPEADTADWCPVHEQPKVNRNCLACTFGTIS